MLTELYLIVYMENASVFATLHRVKRVWAISSVHGASTRLHKLHKQLEKQIIPGDRLVYLGNILGLGDEVRATVDAVLSFRRAFLSQPNTFVHDVALLRGAQEEMWQRLMQLQFAVNPQEVLEWIVQKGGTATLNAYGGSLNEVMSAIRQGPMAITHWTNKIRAQFQKSGHQQWLSNLKHAAITKGGELLFVHRAINPERPLDAQADVFWWGSQIFEQIKSPYGGFSKIIRTFDPKHQGVLEGEFTISVDPGHGESGPLLACCIGIDGSLIETLEA